MKLLSAVSKLSCLFSESAIPLIHYRAVENIFCKCFNAENLSRSDIAFDAKYGSIGVGIKTFSAIGHQKTEKVAEFNSLSRELSKLKGKNLAIRLSERRNERLEGAKRNKNIQQSIYHIVARKENRLLLFETDYDTINISRIHAVKENGNTLQFEDGQNHYSYNYSKSTLYRSFLIPKNAYALPVQIIEDPYSILLEIFGEKFPLGSPRSQIKGENFVVLPLYGIRNKRRHVFEKSGLNQWNAGGRKRDPGEIYIPIPIEIHKLFPRFFPKRDKHFNLSIPTGETFKAKVCQENSKALMTDPNKAISDWLLRSVLQIEEGRLLTIEKLDQMGFDSVIINKISELDFKIDISKTDSYIKFIGEQD
ncbi:MAG: restriction endonuclease [Bacteroidota bacterium]